jgi:hypothetical protein
MSVRRVDDRIWSSLSPRYRSRIPEMSSRSSDAVEDASDRLRVPQRDRHDQGDEGLLHGPADAPHQPEVEEGDAIPGKDEDVSRMGIAVEDPSAEELAEGGLDDVPGHPLRVVALPPRQVGDLQPFHEVEGEHGGRRERRVHTGHDHEGQVAGGGRHVTRVAGLVGEVELLVDGPVELLDDV